MATLLLAGFVFAALRPPLAAGQATAPPVRANGMGQALQHFENEAHAAFCGQICGDEPGYTR